MSEVAGRMSVQIGAHFLSATTGAEGCPGGPRRAARLVVVLGRATSMERGVMAAGLEAEVDLLDKSIDRLRHVDQIQMGRITTLSSNRAPSNAASREADLVIGAVLSRAAALVVVRGHGPIDSPGAVIIDTHRPGRLRRDSHETTHARSDVPGPRRRALRGGATCPGGPAHLYPRRDQRDAPTTELARRGLRDAARRDPARPVG